MVQTWANAGIDLHLDVTGSRVRASLETALREAVRRGRLRPGTRLPPSRALAADLGIARNTVADAYSQLVAEGWLTARTGAGTWVAGRPAPAGPQPRPALPAARSPRYDLRPGVPDLAAFPRRTWLAAARRAVSGAPAGVFGYPDPRGLPALREALAGYLARARGVTAEPGDILVCAGFTHALALLARVLAARGAAAIAVEEYGHAAHRRLAEGHGLRPLPLPVDASGAATGALRDLPAGAAVAACLLTPAHQFPLGVTLRPERRRAAVSWAAGTGGLVIEDDYDGEFRYDRQPVGAMQALAPEHTVYAGTASKSLAPGLRLGWLALPGWLMDDMVAAKEAAGAAGSTLDELTMAEFITSGGYDRQIRQARLVYRRRRDRLVAALGEHAPRVRVTGIAAGLHALVELPPGTDEAAVTARAAARGLSVDGLAGYAAAAGSRGPALVAGYGRPPGHAFTSALARLCATLAEPPA